MSKRWIVLAMHALTWSALTLGAHAQWVGHDPDWKESEVPPPPAFKIERLVEVTISKQSGLIWGVDPDSIKITPQDSVVRYVVVARSPSGVINAMYEGLMCKRGEMITYARYNKDSGWVNVSRPEWRPYRDSGLTMHAWRLAKEGLCDGSAPPASAADAIGRLRSIQDASR